jgi:hypothetical protein
MQELVANGPARIQTYGAFIANRYKDSVNIVWMMGGDKGSYDSSQAAVEQALRTGINSVAGQQSKWFSAEWDSEMIGTDQQSFGAITLNGTIGSLSSLTYSGAGTLVLGGVNNYTDTFVNSGTLLLGNGSALPAGRNVTVAAVAAHLVEVHLRAELHGPHGRIAVLDKFRETGVRIEEGPDNLRVRAPRTVKPSDVTTNPHPGFPTDMQAQYMALMTMANGVSTITESIFENRYMHVAELQRMGANIRIDGRVAQVRGYTPLAGAQVMATDLRASACLVTAALAAKGETIIDRVYHLDRGYWRIDEKLRGIGADIERIDRGSDSGQRATDHEQIA